MNGKGVIMNSPILTKAAAHVENNKWRTTAAYFCILTLVLLASFVAGAQTTTTVQTGGTPNAAVPEAISNFTIPRAAIVLSGTALNARASRFATCGLATTYLECAVLIPIWTHRESKS